MFEALEDLKSYGFFMATLISIIFIFVSGIFFGVTYYLMDVTQTSFESANCVIENNALVSSCQELWSLALYPFLSLKEVLVWASFFFMFGLVIAVLVIGYQSGKSPVLMGLMVCFVGGLTYVGIEFSNIYRTMLENPLFRSMMINFTVYNKIMLNLPWFCFFVGMLGIGLSIVNYQKPIVNEERDNLNY